MNLQPYLRVVDELISKTDDILSKSARVWDRDSKDKFRDVNVQMRQLVRTLYPDADMRISDFDSSIKVAIERDKPWSFTEQAKVTRRYLVSIKDSINMRMNVEEKEVKLGTLRKGKIKEEIQKKENPILMVEHICSRFHFVVRQLGKRHGGRPPLDISDEYDVQDLLHALLKIHFDDIRTEEWTPSYAGGSSRMDFLLKSEKIVIEAKKTRDSLGPKELGEQLIIDINKYQKHPDCKVLFCFVYDPEERIPNSRGLERDLSKTNDFTVKVLIVPKGY